MQLQVQTQAAFSADGQLSRVAAGFAPRDGQRQMAVAVAQTIEEGGALVAEAGTGVGKTYAYLYPALISGKRVLVSTATKTLQDQLFERDIPQLVRGLGLPARVALLKGRSNYLCLERLELAEHSESLPVPGAWRILERVRRWASGTRTGDLAELSALDERSPMLPWVTSTRDNCLGADCPKAKECWVNLARREAMGADIVVVNHHLFFADMAVRESGVAELLPSVDVFVLDEAHQLNETGLQFLGNTLGTAQLMELSRDVLAAGMQTQRSAADWLKLSGDLEHAARHWRSAFESASYSLRHAWDAEVPTSADEAVWREALAQIDTALCALSDALAELAEGAPEFARLSERSNELSSRLAALQKPCATDAVRWVDTAKHLRAVESPLDIAKALSERVWPPGRAALALPANEHDDDDESLDALMAGSSKAFEKAQAAEVPRQQAWVFASATLGDDDKLSWFTQPTGLGDARVLRVASPFDYARQAAVWVPRPFPAPNDARHSESVGALAARVAQMLCGKTLVLTTTLRALKVIGEHLGAALALWQESPAGVGKRVRVLVQGDAPKSKMVEALRAATHAEGVVVVGSASFWEGVDVPGDALQAVIIDKLPFPPPGDPLVQARMKRIEEQGGNAFAQYHLAEAAVALKQGSGRLIRSVSDHGVLVVCDPRLATASYGKRLMQAIPPMRRLASDDEFSDWLDQLAQTITKTATTPANAVESHL